MQIVWQAMETHHKSMINRDDWVVFMSTPRVGEVVQVAYCSWRDEPYSEGDIDFIVFTDGTKTYDWRVLRTATPQDIAKWRLNKGDFQE